MSTKHRDEVIRMGREAGIQSVRGLMLNKVFGERMYQARVNVNGWTQQHAAALLGYKTSAPLAKIEMGGKAPQWLVSEAAKVYRVSTDYLLGMVDMAHDVSILDAEKKRADALAATLIALHGIVTTDAESKEAFVARVRKVLSACPDARLLEAVMAEREACAKLCDAEAVSSGSDGRKEAGASNCADAIRARGQQ